MAKRILSSDKAVSRLMVDSMLVCAALLLSFVEAIFPLTAVHLPGFKAGLANIAVLFAAFALSTADAAAISLARVILNFLFFGSPTSLLFSLCGSAAVILAAFVFTRPSVCRKFSFIGICVICALAHNAGQLCAAYMTLGRAVLSYTPALLLSSLIFGALTGCVMCALPERLYRFNMGADNEN